MLLKKMLLLLWFCVQHVPARFGSRWKAQNLSIWHRLLHLQFQQLCFILPCQWNLKYKKWFSYWLFWKAYVNQGAFWLCRDTVPNNSSCYGSRAGCFMQTCRKRNGEGLCVVGKFSTDWCKGILALSKMLAPQNMLW